MGFRGVFCRVVSTLNGVTPIITLVINDLLSPLPLQVGSRVQDLGFRVWGLGVWGLGSIGSRVQDLGFGV